MREAIGKGYMELDSAALGYLIAFRCRDGNWYLWAGMSIDQSTK